MSHAIDIGARGRASADLLDGLITLAALVLTFLAFDDITTDHSTSFRAEYTGLIACAGWGVVLIVRLVWRGRRALAGACTVLLAVLWGQQTIGPATTASWQPGYAVASSAFMGFVVVAIHLVIAGAGSGPVRGSAGRGQAVNRASSGWGQAVNRARPNRPERSANVTIHGLTPSTGATTGTAG